MSWELPLALWFFSSSFCSLCRYLCAFFRDSWRMAAIIRWKLHSAFRSAILFSMICDSTSTLAVSRLNTLSNLCSIYKIWTGFIQPSWSWSHNWNISLIFLSWVTLDSKLQPNRKSTMSICSPWAMPSSSSRTCNGLNLSKSALTKWPDGLLSGNCSARHLSKISFLIPVSVLACF